MLETAATSLATFFATIGPLDVAAMFAALTPGLSRLERRRVALRGTAIATAILLVFALMGDLFLSTLGISLAALRTAGGILLLLIGIDMVFARSSGSTSTTDEEQQEARGKRDISVFPLATPLIAGPGAMGAVILLIANTENDLAMQAVVVGSLFVILLVTLVMMLLASQLHSLLGVTGMHVVTRVFGILLSALAVQFIFDGIAQSGLLS
ncbi:MAG: MarC family protein [Gammaproteobacteria bacterium]